MIFITGDMHRAAGFNRIDGYEALKTANKEDYLIVCGDFGFIWHGDKRDDYFLDKLAAMPFTTLFVDGNHENFEALYRYPAETWHGGSVHRIRPSILHLMRGEVFDINDQRFFTMGGASSVDKLLRIDRVSWWREELPSFAECRHAMNTLDKCGWNVDYVITHAAPTSVMKRLNSAFGPDNITDFLEEINERLSFKHWYFGHYHMIADVGEEYSCLYENVVTLGNERKQDGQGILYE